MGPSRFRLYLLPFLLGSACGLGIYFIAQDQGMFFTSIGGVPISDDISMSDVVISEQANGDILFTAMKRIPDVESISLVLTYDPEFIKLDAGDISSSYQVMTTRANEGQLLITIQDIGTIPEKSELLIIRPTGASDYLTLSDVIAHFSDISTPLIVTSLQ